MLDFMSLLCNTSSFIHSFISIHLFTCYPIHLLTFSFILLFPYWSVSQLFIYLASNMSHLGLSNLKETLLIQDLKPALNNNNNNIIYNIYRALIPNGPKAEWKTFSQLASYIIITCRLQIESVTSFVVISHCFYLFIMFQSFSRCLNFTVIFLTVTSEDVCCYIQNIKSLKS